MRSLRALFALILCFPALAAMAQTTTTITATQQYWGGSPLAQGKLFFFAVTPSGKPQTFSSNGRLYPAPDITHLQGGFFGTIVSGALTATLAIPDKASASSAYPLCYDQQLFNTATGQAIDLGVRCDITGTTISADTYVPPITAPIYVTGYSHGPVASVPAHCAVGALYGTDDSHLLYLCGTDSVFHLMPSSGGFSITSATATPLAAGQSPTASVTNGVLSLGIPAGATGPAGPTGATGPAGAAGSGSSVANTMNVAYPSLYNGLTKYIPSGTLTDVVSNQTYTLVSGATAATTVPGETNVNAFSASSAQNASGTYQGPSTDTMPSSFTLCYKARVHHSGFPFAVPPSANANQTGVVFPGSFGIAFYQSNLLTIFVNTSNTNVTVNTPYPGSANPIVGAWYRVCAGEDFTNLKVFAKINDGPQTSAAVTTVVHPPTGPMQLLANSPLLDIGQVEFYSRALSDADMNAMYNKGVLSTPVSFSSDYDGKDWQTYPITSSMLSNNGNKFIAQTLYNEHNSFASLPFSTSASRVAIDFYSNYLANTVDKSIVVRVDGADYSYSAPNQSGETISGVNTAVIYAPSAGSHTYEVISGQQQDFADATNGATAPGSGEPVRGSFLQDIRVPTGYTVTFTSPTNTNATLVIADSTYDAFGVDTPGMNNWMRLAIKSGRLPGPLVNESYGGRALSFDCVDATSCNSWLDGLVTRAGASNLKNIWFGLGINDHYKSALTPTQFATNLLLAAARAHTDAPSATIYVASSSILSSSLESGTGSDGGTIAAQRTAVQSACTAQSWCHFIDGTTFWSAANLNPDGVHPPTSVMAAASNTFLTDLGY